VHAAGGPHAIFRHLMGSSRPLGNNFVENQGYVWAPNGTDSQSWRSGPRANPYRRT